MSADQFKVSVVLCTYNPRPDLLRWAVTSIERQTLPKSDFEFVLVDNRSDPPVDAETLGKDREMEVRVVREGRLGLVHARQTGIAATSAPLVVFVDDDNYLDPDYLEQALAIAEEQPWIGCFGGKSRAVVESSLPAWKCRMLSYLGVRDYGPVPITSMSRDWGEWEPIGAGMVCRRDVAQRFEHWARSLPDAAHLGRRGTELMSGDDTLIAQAAYSLNYSCSYQPSLRLSHWMKHDRLHLRVLARTMAGHGRSHVILQSLKGEPIPRPNFWRTLSGLVRQYKERVQDHGIGAGTVQWFWDLGYYSQARK